MCKIQTLLYSVLILITFSTKSFARTFGDTRISGQIKNYSMGELQLILEEDINRKKSKIVASLYTDKHGRFNIAKSLLPHIYTLKLSNDKSVMLAVDRGQDIVITGDATSQNQLQVTGSEDTRKLEAYEAFRKVSLNCLVTSVRNQIRELTQKGVPQNDPKLIELTKAEIENYEQHKNELIDFIKAEMGTSVAIYATSIRWSGEINIPFLTRLGKEFQAAHPNSDIAERVNEKIKVIASNIIGGTVAVISMPDKNGETVPLATINAKYILVDFWASWCAPCRRESGMLRELYQKFRSDGFEIYGVGLDAQRDTWLKAIDVDKRSWINVSTLQGFETPATFDYAVTALPLNVLIDRTGKVIARNVHGNKLKDLVEQLFLKK